MYDKFMYDDWNVLQASWERTLANPQDWGNLLAFRDCIQFRGRCVLKGLPHDAPFSSMPYLFWKEVLLKCNHYMTMKKVLNEIPKEYVEQYLEVLRIEKIMGNQPMVDVQLKLINERDDEYGNMPFEWLTKMYIGN